MNIEKLRNQFTIFIFFPEIDITAEFKQVFASSGYDAYMFIDFETILDRVKQAAPHAILFSTDAVKEKMSSFVQAVLTQNSEIKFICVGTPKEFPQLLPYKKFGFFDILQMNENIASLALWSMDNLAKTLALTYQNESLIEQNESATKALQEKTSELLIAQSNVRKNTPQFDAKNLIQFFQKSQSKEDLILQYLKIVSQKPMGAETKCVYFKFLPTVMSFVATQGHNIDLERVRGTGAKLSKFEFDSLTKTLQEEDIPDSLRNLIEQNFTSESTFFMPLYLKKEIDGIFIFWSIKESDLGSYAKDEFQIFQLCYQNSHYTKKAEMLEIHDAVTELYNSVHYYKKLEDEVIRAKRLVKPVSVVKISVDQLAEIESKLGPVSKDLIFRSVAGLIKKTSRTNDYACRTGESEISLLLPHSGKKGAALRAERLRRVIENHSFALNGLHVSVSMGVSEFPTLARNAEELDKTSRQALVFIGEKGGNKVCLFSPPVAFKPEFDVSHLEG